MEIQKEKNEQWGVQRWGGGDKRGREKEEKGGYTRQGR